MADRNLINKPVSLQLPEEQKDDKKHIRPQPVGKLGVRERAREVAREIVSDPATKPESAPASAPAAQSADAGAAGVQQQGPGPRAFEAAYFNRDIEATAAANLRARPLAALRGEEGATDLRRVVLPHPAEEEVPAPEQLGQTLALMGAEAADGPDSPQMTSLLRRQGAWAQSTGMTPARLAQRKAELEEKVAARRAALLRFAELSPAHLARASTVAQAFLRQGVEDDAGLSVEEDGDALIGGVGRKAKGLHQRLRKMLGSRR